MQTLSVTLLEKQIETPGVCRLSLAVEAPFAYYPGQWIDLFVRREQHQEVLGVSLTSAPAAEPHLNTRLEIAVKRSAHPVTGYLHDQAQPGERFEISPQGMGRVYFEPRLGDEVVLMAGGIGITPLLSIFRAIRDRFTDTRVTLLYSASTADEFAFGRELRESAAADPRLQVHFFVRADTAGPVPDWVQQRGRIDAAALERLNLPVLAHYFLCGPQQMLTDLYALLRQRGVLRECIHYESW